MLKVNISLRLQTIIINIAIAICSNNCAHVQELEAKLTSVTQEHCSRVQEFEAKLASIAEELSQAEEKATHWNAEANRYRAQWMIECRHTEMLSRCVPEDTVPSFSQARPWDSSSPLYDRRIVCYIRLYTLSLSSPDLSRRSSMSTQKCRIAVRLHVQRN
jgi:hypothetical protein